VLANGEAGVNELHLFAGAGGGILAGHLLGRRCICAVEYNAYARSILVARQNDGTLPPFPIWDDVRTFDGRPWRGVVDVVAGGFPCQDISIAGKGDGLDGERSGLWSEFKRVVREVRPSRVEVENSSMLTSRGLGRVLGDLAELGFHARWGVLGAAGVGAPHERDRLWISADASSEYEQGEFASLTDQEERAQPSTRPSGSLRHGYGRWPTQPGVCRVADGMAHRADRLKAIGNGQVPRVAATAWRLLTEAA
jgi:DNA (cytosine-5)-methyltransferase 1